jgi:uncharacterized protein YpmS
MELILNVFGLDSYAWLVLILLAITMGLLFIVVWLARAYSAAKSKLHDATTDSIKGYQEVTQALNYIRLDIQNNAFSESRYNSAMEKLVEGRLDKVERILEDIRKETYRKDRT